MVNLDTHTEQVRLYAAALINFHGIRPFEYSKDKKSADTGKKLDDVKVGDDPKVIAKRFRASKRAKKKKTGPYVADELILGSLQANKRQASEHELAELAKQANLALARARKLAGEPVVYCCGKLRIESEIDYECGCRNSRRHKLIHDGRWDW